MSLNQLIDRHVETVFFNTDHFAEQILRYVGGDTGNIAKITGIIDVLPPVIDDMRGRGYIHEGTIELPESVEIFAGDAIYFNGHRYEVKAPQDAIHGMKTVPIVRYQSEHAGQAPHKGLG